MPRIRHKKKQKLRNNEWLPSWGWPLHGDWTVYLIAGAVDRNIHSALPGSGLPSSGSFLWPLFSQMYMQPVWELNIYQDDLCSLCLTCKYFYNLASQPSLWYSIITIIVADSHHQYSPNFWLMYLFLITTTISRTETMMLSHFFSLPLSWSLGLPHLSPPWMWSPTLLFLFFTFQGGPGRKTSLILECCLKL